MGAGCGEPTGRVTVGYEVVGGTATAGVDYTVPAGTLVYEPGRSVDSR